jgi:ferredoxin--NADP+ reductase
MAYVVTRSCCSDASCVVACPVNCIHPAPGEPGFAEAEMVYVDPKACVGCGACATACPVDAILPQSTLTAAQRPFIALNAEYYDVFPHADRTPVAVVPPQRRLRRPGPFRVAVVGAGPAGLYTADELLKHPEIRIDVFDRLPTPGGLVRAGVAPDHPGTKDVETLFRGIEDQPGFRYFLGVEIGREISAEELTERYHAVVYTVGAAADRRLGIDGEQLPGSCSSADVVGWYNGHPEKQELEVPLDHERAVVVGNGNVALDVARILTADPDKLFCTDIATLPLTALRSSRVREVVVLGRRGPGQATFTVPELIGLMDTAVNIRLELGPAELAGAEVAGTSVKAALLRELASRPMVAGRPTIVLRFLSSPARILGTDRVEGVELVRNRLEVGVDGVVRAVATGELEMLACGLVVRAVGHHGQPVPGLPYDPVRGVIPNDRGRVTTGTYVAGWIKRGPTGFIGTNKSCAQETVERILDDLDTGTLPDPRGTDASLAAWVVQRHPQTVNLGGWRAIDAEERRRGAQRGRRRVKIVDIDEMHRLAALPRTRGQRGRLLPRTTTLTGTVG